MTWLENLQRAQKAIPGAVLEVFPPVKNSALDQTEQSLGRAIPLPLRRFFTQVSGGIHFRWSREGQLCEEGGGCSIELDGLWELDEQYRGMIALHEATGWKPVSVFPFQFTCYHGVIGLDNAGEAWRLDDWRGPNGRLADSFEQFMDAWTTLGCPLELWHFQTESGRLDAESSEARKWREQMGFL